MLTSSSCKAHYDYQTIRGILDSTFVSTVSFVVWDGDANEYTPFSLPMTAVAEKYVPTVAHLPDDGHNEHCKEFDVYLHGNGAMLLNKLVTERGSVKVCITSTKGYYDVYDFSPEVFTDLTISF